MLGVGTIVEAVTSQGLGLGLEGQGLGVEIKELGNFLSVVTVVMGGFCT